MSVLISTAVYLGVIIVVLPLVAVGILWALATFPSATQFVGWKTDLALLVINAVVFMPVFVFYGIEYYTVTEKISSVINSVASYVTETADECSTVDFAGTSRQFSGLIVHRLGVQLDFDILLGVLIGGIATAHVVGTVLFCVARHNSNPALTTFGSYTWGVLIGFFCFLAQLYYTFVVLARDEIKYAENSITQSVVEARESCGSR
jgi:hypothetical protein